MGFNFHISGSVLCGGTFTNSGEAITIVAPRGYAISNIMISNMLRCEPRDALGVVMTYREELDKPTLIVIYKLIKEDFVRYAPLPRWLQYEQVVALSEALSEEVEDAGLVLKMLKFV